MSDILPDQKDPSSNPIPLLFDEEIEMESCGYAFRPISGFKLEIDGSVYMYSDDGAFEINLIGGRLEENTSIAELHDSLTADFMADVDYYDLDESGIDSIGNTSGFVNDIRLMNAEEEGQGRSIICSPSINQYFYMLVIGSSRAWEQHGIDVFNAVKAYIHFHPQFKPGLMESKPDKHPDLTLETYENIAPDEEFILTIEKGDISLLLAARVDSPDQKVWITEITAPDGSTLYKYNPNTGDFTSSVSDIPLESSQGEAVFFLPRSSNLSLIPGDYHFSFGTQDDQPLQEIQVIIRAGRALDLQKIDLNFWIAIEQEPFTEGDKADEFLTSVIEALRQRLEQFNLMPGKVEFHHPAPDELSSFSNLNIDEDLADCSYMISETVNNSRALNIALVENLFSEMNKESHKIDATSTGSPGMIMGVTSPHACIVANWSLFKNDIFKLAEAIIQQLVVFSGIDLGGTQQAGSPPAVINREIAWRLRRHPIFYDAG